MALDKDTVVRLLMRDSDKLRAYAWMIVRDDHLVDDVLQDLGLVAIRKCGEIKDETHFGGWCRIATRNIAHDLVRARNRTPISLSESVLDSLDADWEELATTPSADVISALRHCIGQLSEYGRQLIELRYREGLRSAELAQRLGRNVNTIYVALTRTHKMLAKCIQRQLGKEVADE